MHGERTLAGRYRLGEVIGGGGMGVVYRGTDLRLRRTVAVKVLSGIDGDEGAVARFEREARAAARVRHPGVVTVYDAGTEHGTPFIVMQCVAGRSLEVILRDEGPLEDRRAIDVVRQVASALAAAHRAGIVHRDVKPANVMVADDGTATVLDFGVARVEKTATLTQTASVLGTPAYMSPEQALGEAADARSDIYALGCVLYAALTGRPPFDAHAPASILHQHVYENPEPLTRAVGGVSSALDALVMHMLAKSPDARPQSATLVARWLGGELEPSSAGPAEPALEPRCVGPAGPETVAPTLVARTLRAVGPRRGRRPTAAPLAVVVAGAIAALVTGSLVAGGAFADHGAAGQGPGTHRSGAHAVSSHHAGRPTAHPSAPTGATRTPGASGTPAGASRTSTGPTPAPPPPSAQHGGNDPAPSPPDHGYGSPSERSQNDAVAAGAFEEGRHGHGAGDGHGAGNGHGARDGHGAGDGHGAADGHGWWQRWLRGRGLSSGHRVVTLLLGGDGQDAGSDGQGD